MRLGVLSDTHGLLRTEVLTTLASVDHILHAGDIGDPTILDRLRQIAPVTAICGNIHTFGPCAQLPANDAIELGGRLLYMLHALADLDLNPAAAGIGAVIYGHSHKPLVETRNNVLFLNPGSAGPRRFSLPITLAFLDINAAGIQAEIVPLIGTATT